MEADDLAAHHCKFTSIAGKKILMASTDEDWYICSRSNVDILYRSGIKNMLKIHEELGFPGSRITLFKSIKGCSSDEVSGVPRFPTKLAIFLVNRCNIVSEFVAALRQVGEYTWSDRLEKHMWLVKRNEDIVTPSDIYDRDVQYIDGQYDLKPLCKALQGYGMLRIVENLGG